MGVGRTRARRKEPSENQKPFFGKKGSDAENFFKANAIQPKLSMSKVNDPAEKEADAAAKQVTQVQKTEKKEEEKPVQKAEKKEEDKQVQKAEKKEEEKPVQKAEKKEEEKPVQKAEKKEEEKPVQKAEKKDTGKRAQTGENTWVHRMAASTGVQEQNESGSSFESVLAKRKGLGFSLPDELRRDMEGKFRTSFLDVRIHTDKEATEMCEAIHALAFAHGYDIYFNEGMYNPDAETGRELLAHELAHIVQQNG